MHPCPDCGSTGKHYSHCKFRKVEKHGREAFSREEEDDQISCIDGCQRPVSEPHPCPFAEDVNNDSESLCNCCAACEYQCSQDI